MLKKFLKKYVNGIRVHGKVKYFCVGRNKTGTTSLKRAFENLGFVVGDQREAELLADKYYFAGNFGPIIEYCKSAQVFQDVPFSWAETYKYLDKAYPGSKFILTIREDAEQWYRSLTTFHSKLFGNGVLPSAERLKELKYCRKGFIYRAVKLHGAPDYDIYNKKILMKHYNDYNNEVISYFEGRTSDLLVINLAEKNSYQKFIGFLGIESPFDKFPWENRT